jgi:hypothetical protein
MICKKYFALFVVVFCFFEVTAQKQIRYIFINSAPGANWTVKKPSTINRKLFDEVISTINAPANNKLKVGLSFIFDFLSADLDSIQKSLSKFLQLSVETKVPILIQMDGANWWNARPDLWNWWDPKQPGYNPNNRKNVEWTGWDESTAIKVSWRNWGKQLRVLPAPNLASPAVVNAHINALNKLIPSIVIWYNALPAKEKYLLGGVKLGHESSIGVNAYYYKDGNRYVEQMPNSTNLDPLDSYNTEAGFSGGLAPLGYAAVKTAGIKNKGRITKADMEQVVYKYLDTLCITTLNLGLPQNLIFTHQGGTYSPWQKHLSFSPASNSHSLPGYSLYSTNPNVAGDLTDVLDRRVVTGWAAAEWWWPGNNKKEWIYNIEQTLQFKNCRFLTIFNWENSLAKYPDGIEAVKEVVAEWK